MTHLATLNKYFVKYRYHFFLGILFVVLTNYFRILAPQLTGYAVNVVVAKIKNTTAPTPDGGYDYFIAKLVHWFNGLSFSNKITFTGLILFGTAIISGVCLFLMRQTIIVMSRHIEFEQKNDIYSHYQKLDASFYKANSTGDLMNRISEDVSRVRMYTGPAIMYFINLGAVIAFSVFFMLKADVKLTIVALAPLPILAFAIYYVNSIINKKSEKIQQQLGELTSTAQESYSGIRVIKSFVQEKVMATFFAKRSTEYRNEVLALAKVESIYFPSITLLVGVSTLLTICIGGLDVVNGVPNASVGKIAEFVMYIQMLTFPVSAIGWTASMIQRAATSQKRINEFLLQKPTIENNEHTQPVDLSQGIKLADVNFTYENTGIKAISNFNLNIEKGDKIAIIGKTGSGKSTLAQLLLRMYDVQSGTITFGNTDIKNAALQQLRAQVSYVPQDVFLFSDTIANNIAFGIEKATADNIEYAAKQAHILSEINDLPQKFETKVGERGITLSGGQKQRISIARALIKKPQLLILDDCLSAVDSNTEQQILNNLNVYLADKTAIVITHRIFSLMQFNKIIVLDQGQIAEQGTHDSLLSLKGHYYQMYMAQQQANVFSS
jgi:ATP-binding cassette, subfamily B, multidrug efflux pump